MTMMKVTWFQGIYNKGPKKVAHYGYYIDTLAFAKNALYCVIMTKERKLIMVPIKKIKIMGFESPDFPEQKELEI